MRLWEAVKATASGVEDDGTYDAPHSAENSAARRAAAFEVTAEDLGLTAHRDGDPFGVIIETRGRGGLSTLTAFANGDASLLQEDGAGIVGRPNHVHVVHQAKRLVARAADLAHLLTPVDGPSPPAAGFARVYVLTEDGLLSIQVAASDARGDDGPLPALMDIADELVSELDQYLLTDLGPLGRPGLREFAKSLAIAGVLAGLTYAAWLIPIAWIRWPLVAIGLFLTAAALFVFYAVLAGSRGGEDGEEAEMTR